MTLIQLQLTIRAPYLNMHSTNVHFKVPAPIHIHLKARLGFLFITSCNTAHNNYIGPWVTRVYLQNQSLLFVTTKYNSINCMELNKEIRPK